MYVCLTNKYIASYTCYKYETHLGQLHVNACGDNSYTLLSDVASQWQ